MQYLVTLLCKAVPVSLMGQTAQTRVWSNSPVAAALASLMCHLQHFLHSQQLFSGLSNGFALTCLHTVNLLPVWENHWFHSCRHQRRVIFPNTIYCVTPIVKQKFHENMHLAEVKFTVVTPCSCYSVSQLQLCNIYAQSCMSSAGWLFFTYILKCIVVFFISELIYKYFLSHEKKTRLI